MKRITIQPNQVTSTVDDVLDYLDKRLIEKGFGSFSSTHEARGVIDEEYEELKEALHNKDYLQIEHELLDLIVAGIFSLVCLKAKTMQW